MFFSPTVFKSPNLSLPHADPSFALTNRRTMVLMWWYIRPRNTRPPLEGQTQRSDGFVRAFTVCFRVRLVDVVDFGTVAYGLLNVSSLFAVFWAAFWVIVRWYRFRISTRSVSRSRVSGPCHFRFVVGFGRGCFPALHRTVRIRLCFRCQIGF
jgi:hypothetical protein